MPQIAVYYAAKRIALCRKMQPILPQNAGVICRKTGLNFAA